MEGHIREDAFGPSFVSSAKVIGFCSSLASIESPLKFLTRETLVTLTKPEMKLDAYRKQRRIQFHARLYVRTVAEHTLRVDG